MKKFILIIFCSIGFFLSKSQEKSYYLGPSYRAIYNKYAGPYWLTDSIVIDGSEELTRGNFGIEFQYERKINEKSSFRYRSRLLLGHEHLFGMRVYEINTARRVRSTGVTFRAKQLFLSSGVQYQRNLFGAFRFFFGLESRFHPMVENRGRYDYELLDIMEGWKYEDEGKPIFYEYFNGIRRFSLSYTIGANFSILKNMDLNIEYETNFTNLASDITANGEVFKIRNRNESINISLLFKLNSGKNIDS